MYRPENKSKGKGVELYAIQWERTRALYATNPMWIALG
jgi:hypothetical protein